MPYGERPEGACGGCGALERQRALVRDLGGELRPVGNARCLEIAPYNARVLGEHLVRHGWSYASLDKRSVREPRDPGAFDAFVDFDRDIADLHDIASGTYELVTLQHVLAEVPDDRAALDEIARVLAPGGRALLEIPWNPDVPETRLIDRDRYGNRRAYGRDLLAELEARFDSVEQHELTEGMYRGTIFTCRAAEPAEVGALAPGDQIMPVEIDAIATPLRVHDAAWTGTMTAVAVTRGAQAREEVRLDGFPVVGDAGLASAHPQLHPSHREYSVRGIFLMSMPRSSLAGPHLVAVRDRRYVEETVRGARSFASRQVFVRGREGWPQIAPGATSVTIEEPVAAIGGKALSNYFHWMTELVPRLLFLRERGRLANLPVVLRRVDTAFGRQTLEWIGVEPRFVEADVVHVERAVIPSFPVHPDRDGRYSSEIVTLARRLRDQYAPAFDGDVPLRLYISRRDARSRRVVNEAAVEERLHGLGFTSVALSELGVDEQIALFSHAEVIVGAHGAGLTNLLFASECTRVVELWPRTVTVASPYWTIASLAGLDYRLLATDSTTSDLRGDLTVDVEALTTLLD